MADLPKLPLLAPHVRDRIHKALLAQREQKDAKPRRRIAMASIGDCERNLWASLRDVPSERPLPGKTLTLFEHGKSVESHVVRLLVLAGFEVQETDPKTGVQFSVEDFKGRLLGYLDGKIKLGDEWRLLEIKSANANQFERCQSLGFEAWHPKYVAQVQMYLGYTGLGEALCVVYNKNDSDIHAERVKFDRVFFDSLLMKAERVLESEKVLARPPEAKSQYCQFCKWCDRNEWCWSSTAEVEFDA